MLTKQTIVDQIEITRIGHIQVRFAKQVVEGETIYSSEPHRSVIECGGNVDAQIGAVNKHLVSMGWPEVPQSEIEEIKTHASVKWTPTVLAKWADKKVSLETSAIGKTN
jgi:hypothetical protein